MTERITGIIDRLADADNYEEVAWLLDAPVENIALSVVDDTMRENAEFQHEAGLPAKVVRYTNDPHACKWCQAQAGTYEYPNVPKDVWRRHERCECIIEYTPAGGGRVDVLRGRGKAWEQIDPEVLAERKAFVGVDTSPMEVRERPSLLISAENNKIKHLAVEDLAKPLTDDEIIAKLAGGDETKGSCMSLADAYMGNKKGWDVTDFRGGKSRQFVSQSWRQQVSMLEDLGVEVTKANGENKLKVAWELTDKMAPGKEYIFVGGKHASIAKVDKGGVKYYLELQSRYENGWKELTPDTLHDRFGCPYKSRFQLQSYLVDIDDIPADDNIKEFLGYINTNPNKQKKGMYGTTK